MLGLVRTLHSCYWGSQGNLVVAFGKLSPLKLEDALAAEELTDSALAKAIHLVPSIGTASVVRGSDFRSTKFSQTCHEFLCLCAVTGHAFGTLSISGEVLSSKDKELRKVMISSERSEMLP